LPVKTLFVLSRPIISKLVPKFPFYKLGIGNRSFGSSNSLNSCYGCCILSENEGKTGVVVTVGCLAFNVGKVGISKLSRSRSSISGWL
jgi:hypothetical protein